jgi:hypothetical protein
LSVEQPDVNDGLEASFVAVSRDPYAPFFIGPSYTVYVRGLAYMNAHQALAAAAEFQKIIDGRTIVVSDPIGALAYLQLGRALTASGDKAKGKSAYQQFLTLWKDADPDVPVFVQAKKEFAALGG